MKKPWLKFYPTDWRADPLLRLCSLAARGLWIELIGYMHEGEPYGHLSAWGANPDIKKIAYLVGRPIKEVKRSIAELISNSVVSQTQDGILFSRRMVRDFEKSSLDQRHGKLGGNPRLKSRVNPPIKAHMPEARGQKETPSDDGESSWPSGAGEIFWQTYPRKVGKAAVFKKLAAIEKSGEVSFEQIISAIATINTKDEKYIPHPLTWLNQGRYLDGQGSAPKAEIGEVVGGYV